MKNKLLFGIAFLFIVLLTARPTNATTINTFSDGSSVQNITFGTLPNQTEGSKVLYLNLDPYANVSSATINISVYPSIVDDTEDSYINSSNWEQRGGYGGFVNETADENWDSFGPLFQTNIITWVVENTTKPTDTQFAYWYAKIGGAWLTPLKSGNASFLNSSGSWVSLYTIDSQNGSGNYYVSYPYAYIPTNNIGDNLSINTSLIFSSGYPPRYYEGEVIWYTSGGINFDIDSGLDGISDYTNTTNFTTSIDMNITAIQNYIDNSCSSDSCLVPINFSLNSSGMIQITDLSVNYDSISALTNCSEGGTKTITFHNYRESNQTIVNGSLDVTFDILNPQGNQTNNYSFTFSVNETHSICLYPAWASYRVDAQIEFDGDGYSQRSYYLTNATLSNSTQNINLYLLEDADSEAVLVYVKDSDDNYVEGTKAYIEKYYLDTNTYKTVVIGETDGNGKFLTYFDLNDIFYRAIVYDLDDQVSNEYQPQKIPDTTDDPEEWVLYLSSELPEYFEFMDKASYYCTWTNATKIIRCVITDGSGLMTQARLTVNKQQLLSYVSICDTSDTGSSVTLTCNVSGYDNGTITYRFFADLSSGEQKLLKSGYVYFPETLVFGDTGLFTTAVLVMGLSLIAVFDPILPLFFAIIGLGIGMGLGLIEISIASLMSLIVIAIIIAFHGRRRG